MSNSTAKQQGVANLTDEKNAIERMQNQRNFRVRQERYTPSDSAQLQLKIGSELYSVLNFSFFGLAILHKEPFRPEATIEASLFVESQGVAELNLRFVRTTETANGDYYSAFEVLDGSLPVDLINAYADLNQIKKSITEKLSVEKNIPERAKAIVLDSRTFFESLKESLDQFETDLSFESNQHREEFEKSLLNYLAPYIRTNVDGFARGIFEIANSQGDKTLATRIFAYYRRCHRDLLYHSPFMSRSLEKPLGYAGDFEMMNILYRNEDRGASLFHKGVERIFVKNEEAQAVRNRVDFLVNKILQTVEVTQGEIHILSVASGPAQEVQRAIEVLDSNTLARIHFYLLDQDSIALRHAQRRILELSKGLGKPVNLQLLPMNIRQLLTRNPMQGQKFELIYSAGLFDYFTDEVSRLVGTSLYGLLAQNAKLVIGNFNSNSPGSLPLSLFLDWQLIYRSTADLERIFGAIDDRVSVEAEEMSVNLFANLIKR